MFEITEQMFNHFSAVLIVPIIFLCSCLLLYELFFNGSFLNNNLGLGGGLASLGIAAFLIFVSFYLVWDACLTGLISLVLVDFMRVWRVMIPAFVLIGVFLRLIRRFASSSD